MDCLPLLRISARLLDLHDSAREPGNLPAYAQEERAGNGDGLYVDLAVAVLDALRTFSHETGNAFSGFDAILIAVRETVMVVDAEDVRYVLNVLSRPTELWCLERTDERSLLVSDKHTNLVEKTFYADDYRLSPVGRAAINVSANISSFAYAEGDALKLLRAIEGGDFESVPVFCDSLLDTIRYESVDLRQECEKGQVDSLSPVFKVKLPKFRKVIEQTSDLLRTAESRLRALRSSDDEGAEDADETLTVDVYQLEQRVLKVYQALESFGRDLADLTGLVAHRRGSAVGAIDFLDAALGLVRSPPTDSQMTQLFRRFGPVRMDAVFPSPVDVASKVRIDLAESAAAASFSTDGASAALRDTRILFLSAYGHAIRERLERGPLPLSEAIRNGWCVLKGNPAQGELLGVYVAPWSLEMQLQIEVRVPLVLVEHSDEAAGDTVFNDLELALQEEGVSQ